MTREDEIQQRISSMLLDQTGEPITVELTPAEGNFFNHAVSDIDYLLNDVKFYRALHADAEAQVDRLLEENQRLRDASDTILRCAEAIEFYMGGPWNCDGPSSVGKAFHIHECIRDIRHALQPNETKVTE